MLRYIEVSLLIKIQKIDHIYIDADIRQKSITISRNTDILLIVFSIENYLDYRSQ